MLYVDVTSSCKSPMSTGVQRVVRSVHRALKPRTPIVPMIWDDQLGSYCTLSARETGFLERAGGSSFAAAAEPETAANPWPWSKLQRHLGHRIRRLDLAACLAPGDTLFVPEIFQDRRIDWFASNWPAGSVRRVAFFHDAIVWRNPELTPPQRNARFTDYMKALAEFDEILTHSIQASVDIREFWLAHGASKTPPVSPHPLVVDADEETRPSARNSVSRSVLFVATLEARKNHLALLAAAEILWKEGIAFELELIGRTTRYWGGRVIAAIEELKKAGRPVRWQMYVDGNRLQQAYLHSRFTVYPSLAEGFGLPIVESIWYGKPCICADRGAIAETARGGGCRLIDVTSTAAIADAMRELLTRDDVLARLESEAFAREFPTFSDYADWLLPRLKGV